MAEQARPPSRTATDAYEVDLEDEESLDEVMEDAVAAVERYERTVKSSPAREGGEEPAAAPPPRDDARRVAALEEELVQAQDRYMRVLADFENFRRRAERDKEKLRRHAMVEPLKGFLEVVDNIHRAMAASGSAEDLKQGLDLTVRHLEELLRKLGVERITAVGEPFDPTIHEAVSREESDEISEPTVVHEMQTGYVLHDRLLRPAMVTVAMPSAGERSVDDGNAASDTSR